MAFLLVLDGPARGQTFDLSRGVVMIGRDSSCTIPIADERISRRHLQITHDEHRGCHTALDVGSANGVLIRGNRLVRGVEHSLENGDEIMIGGTRLRFWSQADTP